MRIAVTKILLCLIVLCGGIYIAENISPFFDGRMQPPSQNSFYVLDAAFAKMQKHNAKEYFPKEYESCEFEIESAKSAVLTEMAQPFYVRDFTYSSQKLSEVQDKTIKLLIKSSEKERLLNIEVKENLNQLEELLNRAKNLLNHASSSAIGRRRFSSAEISYKSAKKLYESKKLTAALKESLNGLTMAKKAISTGTEILSRFSDPDLIKKWLSWKKRAIDESRSVGSAIVVNKERHILELYKKGALYRTFEAELGANSTSQKFYAGDRATPEGYYRITAKKGRGQSKYYMALLINYPNNEDRERFHNLKSKKELGGRSSIGGLIEIHGEGGRGFDWTDGCVALTDQEMEYLFKEVSVGTPVAIIGTEGSGPINSALKDSE